MNLQQYFPVLLFIIVATLIGFALLAAGRLLGPHRPYEEKLSQYECGFEAFGDSRMKFDVRYYLVAILFIMFDLEIAFLFPWAIANGTVGLVGFWTVMVFLAILTVGFIYEWKKGALDWE
ncbi:NADH-quinone oxidoreductase subunit A [Parapusillimonas granuli]|uniref:NADH-quinone oxidoreductase subunit A n=1 Tax=Parapusillimonas granuli TaxID=380911 RepID=A0A853G4E3_9BURK|nr:NADH-quinone oxidoreductase subunit A [Parapusillimonas granuli]MBB5216704.1 NADH-quinone oxidoreductase subunit A [Parapusillimonas granuli]MEB2400033.1 NADH-quinone oxidoreductase subunit A [Alcaligenaceae bacterium]NYT51763.1 NADH-quinone oxidoreductase subunit A [Parapusillimonas granuli]